MSENITQLKSDFRNLHIGVREVHDRPIGTFEHSLRSLRQNSFAVIAIPRTGEIGLISKARNYSTTQYDVMVSYLSDDISRIDTINGESRDVFFGILADLYEFIAKESGLKIAIGLNQHPEGFNLPERSKWGQKMRVQTLKPLHAHVYEISKPAEKLLRMGNLPREEQRDMCDPLLVLTAEVVHNTLRDLPEFKTSNIKFELNVGNCPVGINLHINRRLATILRKNSQIFTLMQAKLMDEYSSWRSIFTDNGQVLAEEERVRRLKERLSSGRYSIYAQNVLSTLAKNLRKEAEVKPDAVFVKGLAITYTFLEGENGNAIISLHPRLMSYGNSADACGLYIDNKEGEVESELEAKRQFYRTLIGNLSSKYQIKEGEFLSDEQL